MKQSIFIFLIFIFSFFTAFSQLKNADADTDTKQKIIQLDQTCNDVMLAGNTKELNNLFADNFKDYFQNEVYNKDSVLKDNTKPTADVTIKNIKTDATVFGNSAVVHGVREEKYTGIKPGYVEFTDFFVEKNNTWQIVASQENLIPVWQARNLEDSEFEVIIPQRCEEESALKSLDYNVPALLRVKNNTSGNLNVYWIGYSGQRDTTDVPIIKIAAGKSHDLHTFFTHPFIVIDANGKCRGIYKTTLNPSMAIIKD